MLNMARTVSLRQIQWIIWILVFLIHVLSIMAFDPLNQALVYGSLNVSTYILIIYGNALVLLPLFYEKTHFKTQNPSGRRKINRHFGRLHFFLERKMPPECHQQPREELKKENH